RRGTGKFGGSSAVEQGADVAMLLQEGGRHAIGDRPLQRFPHDFCLMLAQGHQQDAAGGQDGAEPNRQTLRRHMFLTEKIAGHAAARDRIQGA
ncbi:MAG: hypothetical protein ACK56I_37630, partial [bacterium]